jgi:arylsulfatase A-like enzyme
MPENDKNTSTAAESSPAAPPHWIKTPPVGFYLVIGFFLSVFLVVQDGMYRTTGFLQLMSLPVLLQNIVIVLSFFIVVFSFAGLVFALVDFLVLTLLRKVLMAKNRFKSNYFSNPSCFLFYMIFLYIMLTYTKFFIASSFPGMIYNESLEKITLLVIVLFIVLTLVYFLFFRKKVQYDNIRGFIAKISLPVEIVSLLLIISGFLMVVILDVIPVKKHQAVKKKPDIILFTMDSVRNRSMSLYGYKRNNTPFINKFAQKSFVFHNMMSCSNLTYVCMPAILTGKYPQKPNQPPDNKRNSDMLNVLKANGYKDTVFASQLFNFEPGSFTEYTNLSLDKNSMNSLHLRQINKRVSWLLNYISQDERYYILWNLIDPRNVDFNKIQPDMDTYMSYLADKLSSSDEPVFVWIHLLEAHHPFEYPPYMKGLYKGSPIRFIDQYDTSILYLDYIFEKMNTELQTHGLIDNTMIIISADHGFSFPNDLPFRAPFQATAMANGTFNIPFIVHLPGQKKRIDVKTVVSQVDIAPTILELTKCQIPSQMEGESLKQYMDAPDKMSKKVKISVLAQYFLKKDSNSRSGKWADDDFANVFYDKYMAQLSLSNPAENRFTDDDMKTMVAGPDFTDVEEANNPANPRQFVPKPPPFPKGIDFLKYKCYGVFDIVNDQDFKKNLRDSKTGANILEIFRQSYLVKYYQDI